ncbi:MAG TPA: hypothetical protein V6D17_18790 [Candidatus Obscuribacterales bacterium]
MEVANIYAAWTAILFGFISGVYPGLLFYREGWLGGYSSWRRRVMRLGHISFFGIGFVNLAFALTVSHLHLTGQIVSVSSILFIVGQITMPLICYLSAAHERYRHLFFIPVASLVGAASLLVFAMCSTTGLCT